MLKLRIYRLTASLDETMLLRDTLDRYTNACAFVAEYADANRVYGLEKLRKHPTRRVLLNRRVRNKFGIQSAVAEAAIRRVVNDYANLNPHVRGDTRREVLPTYEDNNWMLCTSATASVVMETVHPCHISPYPFRVSVSTYKNRGGRLRFPFPAEREFRPMPQSDECDTWRKNEMRLGVDPSKDAWALIVAVEVPEEEVLLGEDGSDPREHPDYQESDDTPPEDDGYGYVSPDEVMD